MAIALPIPCCAPVTSATCPVSSAILRSCPYPRYSIPSVTIFPVSRQLSPNQLRVPGVKVGDRLERMRGAQQKRLRQMLANQLEADWRPPFVEPAIQRNRRHAGEVELGRVAQQMRKIALHHLEPLRG